MPAGLLPLQADTAAFRRLPAPAPPVAGLSSLAPWAPRGLCSRLCRDAHSRRLNPADPHHCCFSTRDATSLLVLQSNFRGRGFPRLCTARESGGTWLLGCSPGFPPADRKPRGPTRRASRCWSGQTEAPPLVKPPYLGWRPQDRSGGPEGKDKPPQPHPPNTPRSFWGSSQRGSSRVGKDMPPPLKGGQTGPAVTCSRLTCGKSTVTLAPLQWRSRSIRGGVGKNLVAATSSRSLLRKQNNTPNLDLKTNQIHTAKTALTCPVGGTIGREGWVSRAQGSHPASRVSPAASCLPFCPGWLSLLGPRTPPKAPPQLIPAGCTHSARHTPNLPPRCPVS